jgi:quinol monooxygenase YgiN
MIHTMFQYTIRKDKIAEAKKAIDDYVNSVYDNEPGVLSFDVYSTKDDLTYIHLVTCRDEKAREIFDNAPHRVIYLEAFFAYCETISQAKELKLLKSKRS